MSDFLNRMKSAAKADLKTIVLPEGEDPRTIVAATKIIEEGLAKIVILGNPTRSTFPALPSSTRAMPRSTRSTRRSLPSSAPRRALPSSRLAPR